MQFQGEKYDYGIQGTNLASCILSAALSRAGKKILQVDSNKYYGSKEEATLNLEEYVEANEICTKGPLFEEALTQSRKFLLEQQPKIMYANGSMVSSLVKSKVSRYLDFRNVNGFYIKDDAELLAVPCSKSELFKTSALTPIEKRKMMKFITDETDLEESDQELKEYLKKFDLSSKLQRYILSSLTFADINDSVVHVKEKLKLFLSSYGKYGPSAFLYPIYGNSELHQAFSRYSAVFGGTFCLDFNHDHEDSLQNFEFISIPTEESKQKMSCVVTKGPMFPMLINETEKIDLVILEHSKVLHISANAGMIAPDGYFVSYFFGTDKDQIMAEIDTYLNKECLVLIVHRESKFGLLDYDAEINAAEKKFRELIQDENIEFLESAPDPEDVIIV